jgi:hypothetical protein
MSQGKPTPQQLLLYTFIADETDKHSDRLIRQLSRNFPGQNAEAGFIVAGLSVERAVACLMGNGATPAQILQSIEAHAKRAIKECSAVALDMLQQGKPPKHKQN